MNRVNYVRAALLGVLALMGCTCNAWPIQAHPVARRTAAPFDKRPKSDALVKAAASGNLIAIRKLLHSGVSQNAGSGGNEGVSALSVAATNGRFEAVKLKACGAKNGTVFRSFPKVDIHDPGR